MPFGDKPETGVNRYNPLRALFIVAILGLLLARLAAYLRRLAEEGRVEFSVAGLLEILYSAPLLVYICTVLLSLLLIYGIVRIRRKLIVLRETEEAAFRAQQHTEALSTAPAGLPGEEEVDAVKNPQWQDVEEHAETDNPNDWRYAIMEADILLDRMLSNMGYQGESVGEKLKQADKTRFSTLDKAWEAHKVRNALAHEGSKYRISQRETRRVVDLYRQVFEEFGFV